LPSTGQRGPKCTTMQATVGLPALQHTVSRLGLHWCPKEEFQEGFRPGKFNRRRHSMS